MSAAEGALDLQPAFFRAGQMMKNDLNSSFQRYQVFPIFVLGVFFLFAAYLNLNDPDWILWSTAYSLGALICGWTVAAGAAKGVQPRSSRLRRSLAMAYGAACLGLAYHSAFLSPTNDGDGAGPDKGLLLSFLSSEVAREAGGALIMAQAMALCTGVGSATAGGGAAGSTSGQGVTAVGIVTAAVALAAIVLGAFLPGYLQRTGIAVPAHCGGIE